MLNRVKALLPHAAMAGLGAVVVLLVLVREDRAALAVGALLLAAVGVMTADLRARTRNVQHMQRVAAERQREFAGLVASFLDDEGAEPIEGERRNNLVARLEATERRVLAALEAERLRAADGRAELAAQLREGSRQEG